MGNRLVSLAYKKVDKYYFLLMFFAGCILGVVLGFLINGQIFSSSIWVYISIISIFLVVIKLRRIMLIAIFGSGLILGLWRADSSQENKSAYKQFFNQQLSLKGIVSDDVYIGKNGDQRFKLKNIEINQQNYKGEVWVSSYSMQDLRRSDTVIISGQLREGFAGFFATMPSAEVNEIQKTSSNDIGISTRDSFASEVKENISEPASSLGLGFLLGQKNSLPEDLDSQIRQLGLSHVIVASGYNLTILVAFSRRVFQKISKYLSAVFGGSLIAGFMLITGFSPSMSRAGLVAGLSLVAWYYGRKIHPVSLLVVSAGITLLVKPSYILGDLGWFLSFAAFTGVLVLAPLIQDYFWGTKRKESWLRELVVVTFSAQLMTLPIILYSFGLFSVYSLLANIIVLPFIPIAMLMVFLAGVASILMAPAAGILSLPAELLVNFLIKVIQTISGFPNSLNELSISLFNLFVVYLGLFVLIFWLKLKTKHNFLKDKTIID